MTLKQTKQGISNLKYTSRQKPSFKRHMILLQEPRLFSVTKQTNKQILYWQSRRPEGQKNHH